MRIPHRLGLAALVLSLSCSSYKESYTFDALIAPDQIGIPVSVEAWTDTPKVKWSRLVKVDSPILWKAHRGDLWSPSVEAEWTVKLGSIDAAGRYRAPSAPGQEEITAKLKDGTNIVVKDSFEVLAPPRILSLESSRDTIAPGGKVTLRYQVDPGHLPISPLRLRELNLQRLSLDEKTVFESRSLAEASGSLEFTLGSSCVFRLTAYGQLDMTTTSKLQILVQ